MSDQIERCSCSEGLGALEHARDCIISWEQLADERLSGERPDCIYECGTWAECMGECDDAKNAITPEPFYPMGP